eukprot:gene9605-biopygen15263
MGRASPGVLRKVSFFSLAAVPPNRPAKARRSAASWAPPTVCPSVTWRVTPPARPSAGPTERGSRSGPEGETAADADRTRVAHRIQRNGRGPDAGSTYPPPFGDADKGERCVRRKKQRGGRPAQVGIQFSNWAPHQASALVPRGSCSEIVWMGVTQRGLELHSLSPPPPTSYLTDPAPVANRIPEAYGSANFTFPPSGAKSHGDSVFRAAVQTAARAPGAQIIRVRGVRRRYPAPRLQERPRACRSNVAPRAERGERGGQRYGIGCAGTGKCTYDRETSGNHWRTLSRTPCHRCLRRRLRRRRARNLRIARRSRAATRLSNAGPAPDIATGSRRALLGEALLGEALLGEALLGEAGCRQ